MKATNVIVLIFCCILLTNSGCKVYSFTGANISPDIKTFSVDLFQNRSNNGPASLAQTMTDAIKQKFQTEANLKQVSTDGDIQFRGSITGFAYTSEAPTANTTNGLNRLTITIQVDFVNIHDDKDKWSETFSRYSEYNANLNVLTVEPQLITDIDGQLMDDIFQKALVKW